MWPSLPARTLQMDTRGELRWSALLHIGQVESAHCSCILAPSPHRNRCQIFTNICRVDYFCKPLEVLLVSLP